MAIENLSKARLIKNRGSGYTYNDDPEFKPNLRSRNDPRMHALTSTVNLNKGDNSFVNATLNIPQQNYNSVERIRSHQQLQSIEVEGNS